MKIRSHALRRGVGRLYLFATPLWLALSACGERVQTLNILELHNVDETAGSRGTEFRLRGAGFVRDMPTTLTLRGDVQSAAKEQSTSASRMPRSVAVQARTRIVDGNEIRFWVTERQSELSNAEFAGTIEVVQESHEGHVRLRGALERTRLNFGDLTTWAKTPDALPRTPSPWTFAVALIALAIVLASSAPTRRLVLRAMHWLHLDELRARAERATTTYFELAARFRPWFLACSVMMSLGDSIISGLRSWNALACTTALCALAVQRNLRNQELLVRTLLWGVAVMMSAAALAVVRSGLTLGELADAPLTNADPLHMALALTMLAPWLITQTTIAPTQRAEWWLFSASLVAAALFFQGWSPISVGEYLLPAGASWLAKALSLRFIMRLMTDAVRHASSLARASAWLLPVFGAVAAASVLSHTLDTLAGRWLWAIPALWAGALTSVFGRYLYDAAAAIRTHHRREIEQQFEFTVSPLV